MNALIKEAQKPAGGQNILQGRTEEIVTNLIQVLSNADDQAWDRLMRRLRGTNPRVHRIVSQIANSGQQQPGGQQQGGMVGGGQPPQ